MEEHPGGDAILTHAGDDSTEGFYGYENLLYRSSMSLREFRGMHL